MKFLTRLSISLPSLYNNIRFLLQTGQESQFSQIISGIKASLDLKTANTTTETKIEAILSGEVGSLSVVDLYKVQFGSHFSSS